VRIIILLTFAPDKNFGDMILNTDKRHAGDVPASIKDKPMPNKSEKEYSTQIRIAGNTIAPCFAAVKQKGYSIEACVNKDSKGEYSHTWDAVKEGRRFSATCPVELLGLISMWEVRGDNWKANDIEYREYDKLATEAPVYDDDGNLIENDLEK
jgi:hypothetical protein